jgi:hypothetical protein
MRMGVDSGRKVIRNGGRLAAQMHDRATIRQRWVCAFGQFLRRRNRWLVARMRDGPEI